MRLTAAFIQTIKGQLRPGRKDGSITPTEKSEALVLGPSPLPPPTVRASVGRPPSTPLKLHNHSRRSPRYPPIFASGRNLRRCPLPPPIHRGAVAARSSSRCKTVSPFSLAYSIPCSTASHLPRVGRLNIYSGQQGLKPGLIFTKYLLCADNACSPHIRLISRT
ncbi:hypothetical protein HPP92_018674 [Vanilla planifolia]|uniref:Uncharacterized protein n=1 Tax=Vanilla planifolia TaxID=51239 RepID=A0A835UL08_VANPL|nr:hypothetical protein HPP92_018674 [Vanilla planifolia]